MNFVRLFRFHHVAGNFELLYLEKYGEVFAGIQYLVSKLSKEALKKILKNFVFKKKSYDVIVTES